MKRGFRNSWLAPFVVCFCVTSALAQEPDGGVSSLSASEHFAAGSAAFKIGDNRRALEAFQAAIAAGSNGPAVHYNVAVCYYRLGEYARAEEAFRVLGQDFPQMKSLADYNIGLALVRLDQNAAAREAFEFASLADDDQIADLANAMLASLPGTETVSSSDAWIRLVDFRFGSDDNVALSDPLSLPAGLTTDSPFTELQLYVGGPLQAASAWRFDASAFLVEYPDASGFDQAGIYLSARHEHRAGNWRVFVRPQYGRTNLNGDGFEQYFGLSLRVEQQFSSVRTTFGIELSHDLVDEIESQFSYIDGDRSVLALRADKSFDRSRLVLDYRIQEDDRIGAGVSADRHQYRVRFIKPLTSVWTGEFQHAYRVSDYDRLSTPRKESRHQTGVRATRDFSSGWQIALRYLYADNDSNDSAFSYRRNRVSFGASKVF